MGRLFFINQCLEFAYYNFGRKTVSDLFVIETYYFHTMLPNAASFLQLHTNMKCAVIMLIILGIKLTFLMNITKLCVCWSHLSTFLNSLQSCSSGQP